MNTSKIIKGVVSNGRYTVTAPIVKEDYGLYLQIEGVELPSTYEVDFSNSENSGTSVTMIGNADGVLIPHQFIDTGKDIFAFLYHVGANYGRTVYKFRIPNKLRPDRTDDTPTPEEQSVIDQAISALNTAVAQTAQDVVDAEASAQAAGYDADRAEEARSASLDYAEQAEASAISAEQSATASANSASASANSASQSAQIKADVEELVDDAQGYAESASQSATASANSATTAQGYAQSASSSAQSASDYASQAQTSANTASAKAQDASQSATTATQKATESAQSATTASNKATEASGYATASQTAQGLAESARDSAISAKTDAEQAKADVESARDEAVQAVASISGALDDKADVITDTASGAVASFPDGADNLPLKSLIVDINPVQDLSNGDPSPENICPISGWEGMQLKDTGKNLWGGEFLLTDAQTAIPSGAHNEEEKYFQFSSGASVTTGRTLTDGVVFKENTQYTFILTIYKTSGAGANLKIKYTDGTYTAFHTVTAQTKTVIMATSTANKTIDYLAKQNSSGSTRLYYDECGIFEGVLTEDDFEPFGTTLPISWQSEAGTVYGGKLDVLSGELTVEFADVDLGTLTWTYQTNYHRFNSSGIASRVKIPSNSNVNVGGICSAYVVRSVSQVILNDSGLGVSTSGTIGIIDTRFTDPTEFKTVVDGVHYVYPLATPITIQLTPHEVNSLLGQNNIFADTGDTSCEYRADTKLYIERLTAPDSADMIADANITSGQYFMVGNSLYKATANIASGASVIVGTNATRKSLSEALNEINA